MSCMICEMYFRGALPTVVSPMPDSKMWFKMPLCLRLCPIKLVSSFLDYFHYYSFSSYSSQYFFIGYPVSFMFLRFFDYFHIIYSLPFLLNTSSLVILSPSCFFVSLIIFI
uniref:Uncharacterized protein n=1 Tax=Cacopsylla melanoneura TaxID=428564 RepID=A0A8D8ZAI6_9HEMI